jgi:hypothetical protein
VVVDPALPLPHWNAVQLFLDGDPKGELEADSQVVTLAVHRRKLEPKL